MNNSRIKTSQKTEIKLTGAEKQSNHSRVEWAEGLILQLPRNHEGAESWLINYGHSEVAVALRAMWEERNGRKLVYSEDEDAYK